MSAAVVAAVGDLEALHQQIREAWLSRDGAAALALLEQIRREADRLADLSATQERSDSVLWTFEGDRSAQQALDLMGKATLAAQVARRFGERSDAFDDAQAQWCAAMHVKLGIE